MISAIYLSGVIFHFPEETGFSYNDLVYYILMRSGLWINPSLVFRKGFCSLVQKAFNGDPIDSHTSVMQSTNNETVSCIIEKNQFNSFITRNKGSFWVVVT